MCVHQVSQTISRGGPRSQVAIPAQGMIEFRDALTDLLDEFGVGDEGSREEEKLTSKLICSRTFLLIELIQHLKESCQKEDIFE